MKFSGTAIALLAAPAASLHWGAATAQVAVPLSASADDAPAPSTGILTLGIGVPVTLAVAQEVNSSTHDEGDTFPLTVTTDVKIGDTIVIPRGAPATGEITWRTGKGAFGKSGKMELSLRYINLSGQRIPITGDYRQEGEGNTLATGVAIIAVGVLAGFVTGKRARLPMGRELMAQIARPVEFTPDGKIAPSYDGEAAMAAAAANLPAEQCRIRAERQEDAKARKKALKKCGGERFD